MKSYRIGCSGWSYDGWVGTYYPSGTRPAEMLPYYSRDFDTVELNVTFYRFPTPAMVRAWTERTPERFVFSAKLNRMFTHYRKLKGGEELIDDFLSPLRGLGEKLGPILVQLPPGLGPDHALLESFLALLPADLRYAVEFRDERWISSRTLAMLEVHKVALCLIDAPHARISGMATAPFAYVRWHGRTGADYDYSEEELRAWARELDDLPVDEVYGYFNNDVGAHAPYDAMDLLRMLGQRKVVQSRFV